MGRTLITAPVGDVVTTAEAKAYAKVTHSAEDSLIDDLVVTAVELVQQICDRQLLSATYDLTFDAWPSSGEEFEIPFAPTTSITSIKYIDEDGAEQTLSSSVYVTSTDVDPAQIYLAYNQSWPGLRAQRNAVTVRAVVGYANAAAIPTAIKTAIKIAVTNWLENREGCQELPPASVHLINRYRFRYF